MQITCSNSPVDKLLYWIDNKKEEISQVKWIIGKSKECECKICGDKLNNRKDMYSPMQCGWYRIGKYRWICHNCLEHRNFKKYIDIIDEDECKSYYSKRSNTERLNEQETEKETN